MSKAIKRSSSIPRLSAEQELRRLLNGFDALLERTLVQLNRADAALDEVLTYFADQRNGATPHILSESD